MNRCPYCEAFERQIKAGRNRTGSQRYQCQMCGRHYTPEPNPSGYAEQVRQQAVRLYLEGINFRRIARILSVNHQSVINWINSYRAQMGAPEGTSRMSAEAVDFNELLTFEKGASSSS